MNGRNQYRGNPTFKIGNLILFKKKIKENPRARTLNWKVSDQNHLIFFYLALLKIMLIAFAVFSSSPDAIDPMLLMLIL